MPGPTQVIGALGETEAAGYLQGAGFRIEARNFFTPFGELDIVAWDGETLVFVEVKAFEWPLRGGGPAENVHYNKQRKIAKAAGVYLKRMKKHPYCRFDVVTVIRNPILKLEHYVGAFTA
jgi:putative endonuclease